MVNLEGNEKKPIGPVQRRPNYQEHRRTVENNMQTDGGSSLKRLRLWVWKLVVKSASTEKNQSLGNKHDDMVISYQNKGRRDVGNHW